MTELDAAPLDELPAEEPAAALDPDADARALDAAPEPEGPEGAPLNARQRVIRFSATRRRRAQ